MYGAKRHNTYRIEITALPTEKLENVHGLEQRGNEHGISNDTMQLVLLDGKSDNSDAPAHHSKAAIDQLFKTDAEHLWMQLGAMPQVPHNTVRRSATIGVGRIENTAKIEQHGAH